MKERKEKDLYIKYGKKRYQTRECKELDPEQKNNNKKIAGMIRLISGISYYTRLTFKIEVWKKDN